VPVHWGTNIRSMTHDAPVNLLFVDGLGVDVQLALRASGVTASRRCGGKSTRRAP